ncbi:cytochrome P450 4C1-like [Cryptotermes secundus]|uniref:cytochrome P450 4C1-like n=1 Tax=Cryptotermes secundus TaxID=105785 RepID=UPI001454BC97|nr:cytochrome P450 4C1-like [Cryptotermes secundus]
MVAIALNLFVAIFILIWAYFTIKTRHMARLAKKIPGPKQSPFWKKLLKLRTGFKTADMFQNMVQISREYDSTFCFWKGYELFVFVQDVKHIAALLSDGEEVNKSCTYKFSVPWLGSSLPIAEGKKWRIRRKLIAPEFRPSTLESSVQILNSNLDKLINRLSTFVGGPEFDVHPFMILHSFDNVCETFMGAKMNAQQNSESEFVRAIKAASPTVHARSQNPLLHPDLLFHMSSLGRQQARYLATVHATSKEAVEERAQQLLHGKGSRPRIPILDMLIKLSREGRYSGDLDTREEMASVLITGYEATAAALSFACWMLSRHQDVQEKVLMEQKEIFGDSDRPATYRDIQEMKYLEMVIRETIRLYPTVPVFGRKLQKDIDVGDFVIPVGANVMFLAYQIHRNPKYFPDPEKFNPDRFLPDNVMRRSPYCYLAFSAGPRNCVGLKYGLQVIKGTLCSLIRRFRILPGSTPLSLDYTIALGSKTGMRLRLRPR